MTMRYPQWNYITVQRFVFTNAIVSELHLLKRKKKKKKKNNNNNNNNNNEKMNNWCKDFLIFNTFPVQWIMPFFNQS